MKKLNTLFILLAVLFSFCTKEDNSETGLTVNEFKNYTVTSNNNRCGEPLNHEGEYVTLIGYVEALNTFVSENRFFVFDSETNQSQRVEIKVIDRKNLTLDKLKNNLDFSNVENFTKFQVRGKIFGTDLPLDSSCSRTPFLVIDNHVDISVMN